MKIILVVFLLCLSGSMANLVEDIIKKKLLRSLAEDELEELVYDISKSSRQYKDDTFCSGKPDDIYPDAQNCQGFIQCSGGITYKKPCPSGLKYIHRLARCDYGSCNAGSSLFCDGKVDGEYRHPRDCQSFVECSDGVATRKSCKSGNQFSTTFNRCIPDNGKACLPNKEGPASCTVFGKVFLVGETITSCSVGVIGTCESNENPVLTSLCKRLPSASCEATLGLKFGVKLLDYHPLKAPQCICQKAVCCKDIDCTSYVEV